VKHIIITHSDMLAHNHVCVAN